MTDRPFEFDLFRLVIVEPDVFAFIGEPVDGDRGILRIVQEGCSARHDVSTFGAKNQWKWSLRDFDEGRPDGFDNSPGIATTRFARSLVEQSASIVTDDTIVEGLSHAEPAAAVPLRVVFYLQRHLVAVEHNSAVMSTKAWLDALHEVFDLASVTLDIRSQLRLEPVPEANQVLEAFFAFQRLTHLRATLLLPNPEISRHAKVLYDQAVSRPKCNTLVSELKLRVDERA